MEVLVISFQEGDFLVVVAHIDFIFSRECVCRSHIDSSFHSPFDVIFLQEQPPLSLLASEILGLFEIFQILVVCDYNHQVFSSGEVVLPFLQSLNNSKEFSIIDVVVLFHQGEGGGMISAGVEIPIRVFLHQHSPRGSEGSVCHDEEGFGSIRHLDYWGREECFFEFDKCIVLFLSPPEGNPFFGQVVKWLGECGEVRDELSVKVAESDEGSNCFY